MNEIHTLLSSRWIMKSNDPETYFKLKDSMNIYKGFFKEKLGYSLIVNPLLIKVEKIPGRPQTWMGIGEFDSKMAYVFFCLVLMFLEELDQREQFVLAQVTDFVQGHYPEKDLIDWTLFSQRKSLIKVMRFCTAQGLIAVNDGDDGGFASAQSEMAVLYENTGASKYFMRRFATDIHSISDLDGFEDLDWQSEDRDRGLMRRHRVYRRLVMEPVVYEDEVDDQDYLYIKNQRSVIANDMERFLGAAFHLHQNGAFVMLEERHSGGNNLPNRKNISDIVLQINAQVRSLVLSGVFARDEKDCIVLSKVRWQQLLQQVRDKYGAGWSKSYREMSFQGLTEEIEGLMCAFGLLEKKDNLEISLMPACGKLTGDYPEDYWIKREEKADGTLAD